MHEPKIETIAETEMYLVWVSTEDDGEKIYHAELGNITVHFLPEEWDEFVALMLEAVR